MAATGYGVTPQGFVGKPLSVVSSEIDSDLKAILGESAGTEADGSIPPASLAGQLKALVVDGIAEQWDGQQAVYSSFDPNQANDASQDAVCALSGTLREAERQSIATGLCVGVLNTALPAGREVTVTGTGTRFSAPAATLTAATAWAGTTTYNIGDRVTNNGNVYVCRTGGVSAGSGGPTTTASDITDNTVHWRYLGAGTAVAVVLFTAEAAGPFGATAGTLVNIATPVTGWNAVYNENDAVVGQYEESNAALRARRDAEVAAAGNTTRDSIRANVLAVNQGSTDPNHQPPSSVEVFVNDTDITDANGVPPHSIEVLVLNGTSADIAQAIWNSKGAGTATTGGTSATAIDSEGNSQTVYFTRPTQVPIYIVATARYDASAWPAGSDSIVAQRAISAILTKTQNWPIGQDVRISPLISAVLAGPSETDSSGAAVVPASAGAAAAPGILELDPIYIGTSPAPSTSTQVTIDARSIATFSSTNLAITASTESP